MVGEVARARTPHKVDICICTVVQYDQDIIIVYPATDHPRATIVKWMMSSDFALKLKLDARNFGGEPNCAPRCNPIDG